jgi:hypothetical protein
MAKLDSSIILFHGVMLLQAFNHLSDWVIHRRSGVFHLSCALAFLLVLVSVWLDPHQLRRHQDKGAARGWPHWLGWSGVAILLTALVVHQL